MVVKPQEDVQAYLSDNEELRIRIQSLQERYAVLEADVESLQDDAYAYRYLRIQVEQEQLAPERARGDAPLNNENIDDEGMNGRVNGYGPN